MGLLTGTEQHYYNFNFDARDGNNFGGYQFTSLTDIINQFMLVYVGEDKIIPKAKRLDVAFHAQRALAELSFDTLKSIKAQEITVPASLHMILPRDYVNYTKISWVDSAGIKHLMYPTSKTSNPKAMKQDAEGKYSLSAVATVVTGSQTIVLDNAYPEITVGMSVLFPHFFNDVQVSQSFGTMPGALITATSTVSGITTITISTAGGASFTGSETVYFRNPVNATAPFNAPGGGGPGTTGGELLSPSTAIVLTNLSFVSGIAFPDGAKISASSAADAAQLSVGMLISHEFFPVGTTIIDINGSTITASQRPTATGTATNVNFVSYDKISDTATKYKSATPSENNHHDHYHHDGTHNFNGKRYGLDPQHAQVNGSFYIDIQNGKIHFSSNISGKTVILDYISDSLGTDGEMQVHKFAEEAMYKWISHAILSGKANVPEYQVNRLKKERFAAIRTAKLRLSNIKLEELTQILRGKSKQIKH